MTNILILGTRQSPETQALLQQLQARDVCCCVFNNAWYPGQVKLSWSPDSGVGLLHEADHTWALPDFSAAFWQQWQTAADDETKTSVASQKNQQAVLSTLLYTSEFIWYNPVSAIQFHHRKPQQLYLVRQLGLRTPATYVGNYAADANDFARRHQHIVLKPAHGGGYCRRLTASDYSLAQWQAALAAAPLTVQQFISGTNVRSYVIGQQVLSAELRSNHVDFRTDIHTRLCPHTLPDTVQQQAILACQALGMRWTAIDWRLTPEGEYVFLEANPAPYFCQFEAASGLPVTATLADLLCGDEPD